ncbi:hypothetical protein IWQ62_001209 [Dispira parvispora]|uniref:Uncharacterized protein n=1 Tax=Dispira parvispora TaxID=1520584 RepID=A0A9W8AYI1_9FUNG|nr:hypothetical protein IWQ62_001209 [Dispira parvispora]
MDSTVAKWNVLTSLVSQWGNNTEHIGSPMTAAELQSGCGGTLESITHTLNGLLAQELVASSTVTNGSASLELYRPTTRAVEQVQQLQSKETKLNEEMHQCQRAVQEQDIRLQNLLQSVDPNMENVDTDDYIRHLHQYNELKDIGQRVIGKVGFLENIPTSNW